MFFREIYKADALTVKMLIDKTTHSGAFDDYLDNWFLLINLFR